jgi:histidinol-phosphate phosphatase family protein
VTNQAGVARGKFTEEDVDSVHQRIASMVDEHAHRVGLIDRFYYCPYHPEGTVAEYCRDHVWRKPHPGMILQAARDMELELNRSWMIGDQERDIAAGKSAGCRTILITRDAALAQRAGADVVVQNFAQAVAAIVDRENAQHGTAAANRNGESLARQVQARSNPQAAPHQSAPQRGNDLSSDFAALRRTIAELAEEIRSDRMRRADFTIVRMLAGLCQLLAVLLAVLALMQLSNMDVFIKWMAGAGLAQLFTITLLLLDLKG